MGSTCKERADRVRQRSRRVRSLSRIGKEDGQQSEIGQHDGSHAEPCRDRHFLDCLHLDERDRREPRRIRGERRDARTQEAPETRLRGIERRDAAGRCLVGRADDLDAVTYPDGEYQERHENRQRIDPESEQAEQAKLPDHGEKRTAEKRNRCTDRAGVCIDQQGRDQERDREERRHGPCAVSNVANRLGEADDVHVEHAVGSFQRLLSNPLELVRNFHVIQALAGVGMKFLQPRGNDGAAEVVGDQVPDQTRLDDVLAQSLESGIVRKKVGRQDVATGNPVLDNLYEPHVRRQDREYLCAVNARKKEHRIRRASQRVQVFGREHFAVARDERKHDTVRASELLAVIEKRLHVGMLKRRQLGEACVDAQLEGGPRHGNRQRREEGERHAPSCKQCSFEPPRHHA